LKLGKGIQVALGGRLIVLREAKRLECAERFSLTPQDQVPDGPSAEIFHLVCERCTHTDAGAELLIGRFEACSDVNSVAIGGVVEEAAATEIAYNRWPRMYANPRNP